jgi:hypothetical protein
LWPTTKSTTTKNSGKLLAISIAMRMRQYNAGHITQWSTSVASCKAFRFHHQASAHAVLPWRQLWLTILNETKNTTKKHLLSSFLMADPLKKGKQFWDPKQTLYSHQQCKKLLTNVEHHNLS